MIKNTGVTNHSGGVRCQPSLVCIIQLLFVGRSIFGTVSRIYQTYCLGCWVKNPSPYQKQEKTRGSGCQLKSQATKHQFMWRSPILGVSHGSMVLLYFKATFIYHRRKPATEAEQSPQVAGGKPLLKRGLFGFKSFNQSSKIDSQ